MYKEKSKSHQTISRLYETLKNQVQAEQARDAAAASAEHTLQSMGPITGPASFARQYINPARPGTFANMPSTITTPSRNLDRHQGIEQLHPFQRSGSATKTQSFLEASSDRAKHPPLYRPGPKVTSRMSMSATPAQRTTSTRPRAGHTFPQSTHRPAAQPVTRREFEGQDRTQQDHVKPAKYAPGGTGMTPNMHSCMPAHRGLY